MPYYFARYTFLRATCLFALFSPRAWKRAGKRYRPWLFVLQAIQVHDTVRGHMCICIAWCSTACDMHPRSTNRRLWQLTDPFVTVRRCRSVAIAEANRNRNEFPFTRFILFAQCCGSSCHLFLNLCLLLILILAQTNLFLLIKVLFNKIFNKVRAYI